MAERTDQLTAEELQQRREQLRSYLAAATRLRLQLVPVQADRQFQNDGGTVLYAADSNIVYMYIAPQRLGPYSQKGGGGYGVVFEDDEPSGSSAIVAALSRYIFWHLTANPIALLIGHASEARSILNGLANRVDNELKALEDERKRIGEFISDISHELAALLDPGERLYRFKELAPGIVEVLFYKASAASELLRYSQLLEARRLERFTTLIDHPHYFSDSPEINEILRQACISPSTLTEYVEESRLKLDWQDRLRQEKRVYKPLSERADASALARLELVNRRLQRDKCKLALITADEALYRAAEKYYDGHSESFADKYLRHPKAFLSQPSVLLPAASTEQEGVQASNAVVEEWLDLILARYSPSFGPSAASMRSLKQHAAKLEAGNRREIIAAINLDPGTPQEIRAQWRAHLSNLSDSGVLTKDFVSPELRAITSAVDSDAIKSALADLGRQVVLETEKTWDAFLDTAARVGMELTWAEGERKYRRRRASPVLIFDSFSATTRFCASLLNSSSISELNPKEYAANLEAIGNEDNSGYARALAYGVVFAHAGKWHVSALLAARAIGMAESLVSQNSSSVISGREAYYLRAVALRFKAREESELEAIETLIRQAEEAEKLDRKRNPLLTRSTVRFEGERLSMRANKFYFAFFRTREVTSATGQEARLLLHELEAFLDRVEGEAEGPARRAVWRAAVTNVFMILACLEHKGKIDPTFEAVGKRHIPAFLEMVRGKTKDGHPSTEVTWLVMAVGWYAQLRFSKIDRKTGSAIVEEIDELRSCLRDDEDQIVVAPYDRQRFALLIDSAQQALLRQMTGVGRGS